MVGHQNIGMEADPVGIEGDTQAVEESVAVVVIADDTLPGIAPTGDMVKGAGVG